MSRTVSTHVLDAATGTPARAVPVRLTTVDGTDIASGTTDADGRIGSLAPHPLPPGRYRLVFDTGTWFRDRGQTTFYPEVVITVDLTGDGPWHVPVLLSPFAYTTYRGS